MLFCQIVLIDIFEQKFDFSDNFFVDLKENVRDDGKMLQIKFKFRFSSFSTVIILVDDCFEMYNTVNSWRVWLENEILWLI